MEYLHWDNVVVGLEIVYKTWAKKVFIREEKNWLFSIGCKKFVAALMAVG